MNPFRMKLYLVSAHDEFIYNHTLNQKEIEYLFSKKEK